MKFGLHYLLSCADTQSPVERYRETLEQAVHAEAFGFESVWPVEHHFDPETSILPCPTLLLSAIAARTRRLRLGTAIVQLGLCHPLRVAEEVAMLDVLSDGRVELGVGRGGNPAHYAGFDVALEHSRERMSEALSYLRLALREDVFSFEGRHFRARDVRLSPRPVQGPHPTLHMAANSVETAIQAGQGGYPILLAAHVHGFDKLKELIARYQGARRVWGHGPATAQEISVVMPLFVGESRAELERDVAPSVRHYLALVAKMSRNVLARCPVEAERVKLQQMLERMQRTTFEGVNGSLGIFDTPRGCSERLRQLAGELGVGRVIGWFNFGGMVPHERVMRSMEMFAARVMPELSLASAA